MLFRKIVSNLPFSPALVGQLGFYANRLRKEELTRRAGLIFVALALTVQAFAVFSPPESANAAVGNNVIYGGVSSKKELLSVYDANRDSAGHKDIQQIYKQFGITRQDIVNAKESSFNSIDQGGKLLNVGRVNEPIQNKAIKVDGTSTTVYEGLVHAYDTYAYSKKNGTVYKAVVGKRAVDGKYFAIMFVCGNPVYLTHPPAPPKPAAACTSLNAVALSRTNYRFDAKASTTNGAKISGYTFTVKDGAGKTVVTKPVSSTSTSASTTYDLKNDGTYKVTVSVATSVGNKSGTNCADSFTISPLPPQPVAACTSLTLSPISRTEFKFAGKASAKNGATISKYTYVVKDKSGKVIATKTAASKDASNVLNYTFAKDGTYTITLTVTTSLGNKSGASCTKSLTVSPQPRCEYNTDITDTDKDCKPCKDDDTIWYKDENCVSDFEESKVVKNVTQGINNADNTIAQPGDQLQYTLSVKNVGHLTGSFTFSDNLRDVLEYADVLDTGGGTLVKAGDNVPVEQVGTITWPAVEIAPGKTITRIVLIEIKSTIPATPQSPGNLLSYDCKLMNNFESNHTTINVNCPVPKVVEQVTTELPHTGPRENIIFAAITLGVVTFFYARSRQLKSEVRLIRRDVNAGTI